MTARKFNLCHEASFCAENTPVTVVPSFSYKSTLQLMSSQRQSSVGPFVAGIPLEVPLWMAKVLQQRKLAQIQIPEWLSPENLTAILTEERKENMLTNELPFYYFEIARSLQWAMDSKSTMIVLQDLANVRIDKIRSHFHALSKGDLEENEGDLPEITITGICSIELNTVGPFLQRAFSDYGFLTKSQKQAAGEHEEEGHTQGSEGIKRPTNLGSRLRRFRPASLS